MNNEKKVEGNNYQQLRGKTSIGGILEIAILFEQAAYELYTELSKSVSKNLIPLVEEFAAEEKNHVAMLKGLSSNPQAQIQIAMLIERPPSDHRFSDYIHVPEIGELPDDQTIFQYALGREQVAMEQYASLAVETPAGPIHDLFNYLAHEEMRHKQELEKRYYELFHNSV